MNVKSICVCVGTIASGLTLLYGADTWATKDPSQWSSEDVSKLLNDSPWAKHVTASAQQVPGQRGGGRRMGGFGMPGGYPGGGGGYPGGGGGYPGGGGPYGGRGGGYPGSNDGSGRGGMSRSIDATLRWESALPVQLAEQQRHSGAQMNHEEKQKPAENAVDKPYVLTLIGLQIPRAGDARQSADDDSDPQYGSRGGGGVRSPEAMRQNFLENTRITRKNKSALSPSDVKLDADRGEVSFFFRRDEPIELDDKEVTFESAIGRMKIEKKFKLKDMVYQGKLAL